MRRPSISRATASCAVELNTASRSSDGMTYLRSIRVIRPACAAKVSRLTDDNSASAAAYEGVVGCSGGTRVRLMIRLAPSGRWSREWRRRRGW